MSNVDDFFFPSPPAASESDAATPPLHPLVERADEQSATRTSRKPKERNAPKHGKAKPSVMGVRTRRQTANPVAGAERRATRAQTRLRVLQREPKTFAAG
jgi:FtsZ-interacting cell division protein YlmF